MLWWWLVCTVYCWFPWCLGRSQDFYHTCYCLSGLSVCQHFPAEASRGDTTNHIDDEESVILVICLFNWSVVFISLWLLYCLLCLHIMLPWLLHYVTVTNALCHSDPYIVSQWPLYCVIVTLTLCHSDHCTVPQWSMHCVTVTVALCHSLCNCYSYRDQHIQSTISGQRGCRML